MIFRPKVLIIEDSPEVVRNFLVQIRKDPHLIESFDGSIKSGVIKGFYTVLSTYGRSLPVGYTRVEGKYDIQKGTVELRAVQSILFWIVSGGLIFAVVFASLQTKSVIQIMRLIALFIFLCLFFSLIQYLEQRSFIKHMKRVYLSCKA